MRRRRFVQIAATGTLASCAHRSSSWRFLTAAEGSTLAALCEQIVPGDETPGAAWAGVVNYIDRQLMGPFRKYREAYRSGLAALERESVRATGKSFDLLEPARQTALLAQLEGEPKRFFGLVIAHTMQGYYGDPRHGGNRDAVSWRMLGVPVIPIRGRAR